jgi:hypothetical protein
VLMPGERRQTENHSRPGLADGIGWSLAGGATLRPG